MFRPDAEGMISLDEFKRVVCTAGQGAPLNETELSDFLDVLAAQGHELRNGGKVTLEALRAHPCYRVDKGAKSPWSQEAAAEDEPPSMS